MMRIWIAVALIVVSVTCAWAKPLPPFNVDIRSEIEPEVNSFWSMSVVVNTNSSLHARVTVDFPSDVIVLKGQLSQEWDVEPGQTLVLPFELRLPSALVGSIRARVDSGTSQQPGYTARDEWVLGPSANKKVTSRNRNAVPSVPTIREGGNLREYTLP